jgi:hypothetical protein
VEVGVVPGIGPGVDVDPLEPRGGGVRDVALGVGRVRVEVDGEVQVLDVKVAQVEDGRRRVGVDAGAEAGLHPRVERRDDADDGAVVGVERVRLERLLEQRLAAVHPDVAEHDVVLAEQHRVDVHVGGDEARVDEQLARLAPRCGIGIGPVIGRTVLVGVPGPQGVRVDLCDIRGQHAVVPHPHVSEGEGHPAARQDFFEAGGRPLDRADLDPAPHALVEDRRDVAGELGAMELEAKDGERTASEEEDPEAGEGDPPADVPGSIPRT